MFWLSKVLAPAVLVLAIAGSATVMAQPGRGQPPFQPGKGKGNPFRGGDDRKGGDDKRGPGAAKGDSSVDAWVKTLTDKMNDPHDTIRDSARAALVAVGAPALPALKKLAEGNDEAKAVAARKLIAQIEGGPGQPGRAGTGVTAPGRPGAPDDRGGRPAFPGFPGRPGGNPLDRLLGGLNLTEKQQKEVEEITEAFSKKMREFSEKARTGKIERQEITETVEKFQKEMTEQLKKVLNEEQFKKFQERSPGGRFPFPGPFGPGRPSGDR